MTPTWTPDGRPVAAQVRALLLCCWVAAISACSTTSTTTSSATPPVGKLAADSSSRVDGADIERGARARLELASLYLARGQSETALAEVQRALSARPELAEGYSLRGLIQASLNEPALADASFQRALQLAPRDGDAMHNYGWFLCQQARFVDAETQFANALRQSSYRDVVRTQLALGVCQARAGRWSDAERSLSKAYELDPASPVVGYNLAEVLLRRGELERARFVVDRINRQPESATAQSLWLAARIERGLGQPQAVQLLGRRLQERFPQSPEAVRFEQGRFDD